MLVLPENVCYVEILENLLEKNVTTFAVMIFQYSETDTQNQNNLEMSSSEILQQKQFR